MAKKSKAPAKPPKSTIPKKLPSAWLLTKSAARVLWQHKETFAILTLIYGLLSIVLVNGLAGGTNVSSLKHELNQAFNGKFGTLASSAGVFVTLLGNSGSNTSSAGGYQLFLTLVISLAAIWALRHAMTGNGTVRVRDAFYQGMYPLIPFILVLLVIGLQLIPLLIGSTLYTIVISNGIAVSILEKLFWLIIFLVLAGVSLYMLSSSIFAMYIVTLPNMTPRKALRSAKELVQKRRLPVIRKVLWLPLLLLLGSTAIMLPIILWLTPIAQVVFFLLSMFVLIAIHAYMYTLYRELLNE